MVATQRPANDADLIGGLWSDISELSTMVPDSRWWDFYFRFTDLIESYRKKIGYAELCRIYGSTTLDNFKGDPNSADASQEFLKSYQERLNDENFQKKGFKKEKLLKEGLDSRRSKAAGSQIRR
jgi:hypothetical protein